MGKHTRSTKFHPPVGTKTAPKHLHDLCRVHSCLRPKHQCLAHRLNGQGNNNLIAGFDYLARPILPNMHNRFTQRPKDGRQRLKIPSSPPTIMESVPAIAPLSPPLTGASSVAIPRSANRSARVRVATGELVLISMTTSPPCAPSITPSVPNSTPSTSAVPGTIVITTSLA